MIKKYTTTIIALFIACASFAQDKVNFKIAPKQGKILKYEMITKTDIGGSQDVMMDIRLEMSMNPIKVTDNNIDIDVNYSNLKMDMNAGMMMMSYDSNEEPQDDFSKTIATSLAPKLNNTLKIEIDTKGKVNNIDFPNVPEQAFDKSNMRNIVTSFPDKAIAIGETWTDTKTNGQLGVTMKIKYTLEEKNEQGYKISAKGIIVDSNGNEIGEMSGDTIIDEQTHFTKSTLMNSKIDIQGQKITMSTEMNQLD